MMLTENWTKPQQTGTVTLANLETHPKNPMIAKIFRELGWVEELGSGRKNIQKYAPIYYPEYKVEIQNHERFVLSISYANLVADLAPDLTPLDKLQPQLQPQLQPELQPELQKNSLYRMVLKIIEGNILTTKEISEALEQKEISGQLQKVMGKLLKYRLLERTIPDKPNHPAQRYKLTEKGQFFNKAYLTQPDQQQPELHNEAEIENVLEKLGIKLGLSWQQVSTKLAPSRHQVELSWHQVENLLSFMETSRSMKELMVLLGWSDRTKFRDKFIKPLIETGIINMTIPDKPQSSIQKYYLSQKGSAFLTTLRIRNS